MRVSLLCDGSETKAEHEATSSDLGFSNGLPSPAVSRTSEADSGEACGAPLEEDSCDQDEVVVFDTSLLPVVEVEMAQLPPSLQPCRTTLDEIPEKEEESCAEVSECAGGVAGSSPASYFWSDGPRVIRCFQVAS